jgi:hypothetical protein
MLSGAAPAGWWTRPVFGSGEGERQSPGCSRPNWRCSGNWAWRRDQCVCMREQFRHGHLRCLPRTFPLYARYFSSEPGRASPGGHRCPQVKVSCTYADCPGAEPSPGYPGVMISSVDYYQHTFESAAHGLSRGVTCSYTAPQPRPQAHARWLLHSAEWC